MKQLIAICMLLFSFYLGIHNGHLAIWEDGNSSPVMILPIKADILPKADQQRLQEGIQFENPDELTHLLEDFMS